MNNLNMEYLYPTPISYTMIEGEILDNVLNEYKNNSFNFIDTNPDWGKTHKLTTESFDKDILGEKNMDVIIKVIDDNLRIYCEMIGFGYRHYKRMSWITSFNRGEYAQIHDHIGSDISGCFYYETNGGDGSIFFENPSSQATLSFCYPELRTRWYHKPTVGKLLLFPGYLKHGVQTNTTEHNRRSLSFNIMFNRD